MRPVAFALALAAAPALGARLQLQVVHSASVELHQAPVTSGIPWPKGLLPSPQTLRLLDERGKELPLQVQVLSRWPDGSIQWTLLDFQTSVPRGGVATLWLDYGGRPRQARHPTPVVVDESGERVTVSTGVATFELARRGFRLFERVRLAASREPLLVAGPDDGLVAEASEETARVQFPGKTSSVELGPRERVFLGRGPVSPGWFRKRGFRVLSTTTGKELAARVVGASFDAAGERPAVGAGWCRGVFLRLDSSPGEPAEVVYPRAAMRPKRYSSALGPSELAVETRGPLRSVVRVKGKLGARDGSSLLDYVARLHFYAGKPSVRVVLTLVNREGVPLSVGEDVFPLLLNDASLGLRLRLRGPIRWALGAEVGHPTSRRGSFGRSRDAASLVQFRSRAMRLGRYAVVENGRETAVGRAAAGCAGLWAENGGLVLCLRQMAANNPKALRLRGDGRFELGLFPREAGPCEEFLAGRAKTHDLLFVFFAGTAPFLPDLSAAFDGVVAARAMPPDAPAYTGRWPASAGAVELAPLGRSDYDLLFAEDFARLVASRETTGSYGAWRYGDFGAASMRTIAFSVATAAGRKVVSPDLLNRRGIEGMALAVTSGPAAEQTLRDPPLVVRSDPDTGSLTLAKPLAPAPAKGARAILYDDPRGGFLCHRFDPAYAMAREYLRRGDPRVLGAALASARHMTDVCTFHGGARLSDRWLGACQDAALGPTRWHCPGLSGGASWQAGVWLTYLITGDRTLLDAATANARFALRHADDPLLSPQAAALALTNLGFAADAARAKSAEEAAVLDTAQEVYAGRLLEAQKRAGHGAHADSAMAAALALEALERYHRRAPSDRLRASILAAARSLTSPRTFWAGQEAGFPADGLIERWGSPGRRSIYGSAGGILSSALAQAAELGGGEGLMLKARRLERVAALFRCARPEDFALRYRGGDLFVRGWERHLEKHPPRADERLAFACMLESAADVALPELGVGGSVLHRRFVALPDGSRALHAEFPGASTSPDAGLWVPLLDSPNAFPHLGAIEFRILYRKPPQHEDCWLVTGEPRSHGTALTLRPSGLELASTYKEKWRLRILARGIRIEPGRWHHVAFTWNRVVGTALFFDGKAVGQSDVGRLGLARRLHIPSVPEAPEGDYLVRDLRIWRQPPKRFDAALDTTAPARVTDLMVAPAEGGKLLLSWTAPGDDGSRGRASRYDIRLSTRPFRPGAVASSRWAEAARIAAPRPSEAGQLEKLPIGPLPRDRRLYIALRAEDEAGNASPISNAVATEVNHPPRADAGPALRRVLVGSEVVFDASASSDPDGDALTFTWSGGLTGPTVKRRFEKPGEQVVELTASDGKSRGTAKVRVVVGAEVRVNFQPRLSRAAPPGFLADEGLAYSKGRGYGWLDIPGSPRGFDRSEVAGLALEARSGLSLPLGSTWVMDLPNGGYELTIAVGDPAGSSGPFEVLVEGEKVGGFQPGQKAPLILRGRKVKVADGQLTIALGPRGAGGRGEINYLVARPAR